MFLMRLVKVVINMKANYTEGDVNNVKNVTLYDYFLKIFGLRESEHLFTRSLGLSFVIII